MTHFQLHTCQTKIKNEKNLLKRKKKKDFRQSIFSSDKKGSNFFHFSKANFFIDALKLIIQYLCRVKQNCKMNLPAIYFPLLFTITAELIY